MLQVELRMSEVAWSGVQRRLQPVARIAYCSEETMQYSSADVLVSGGFGTIGQWYARRHLSERPIGSVCLLGRSGRGGASRLVGRHAALLRGRLCDVGRAEGARCAWQQLTYGTVGVMHAGGVLQDALLARQSMRRLRLVGAPKLGGMATLQSGAHAHILAWSMLFSSVAALLGNAGQINYAAANALLDDAAGVRRAAGCAAVSVQWTAWSGGGMAEAAVLEASRRDRKSTRLNSSHPSRSRMPSSA